jgi:hypothetical protein
MNIISKYKKKVDKLGFTRIKNVHKWTLLKSEKTTENWRRNL